MIKERPGEPDDRDIVVSSLDCDRFGRDLDAYRDNYDKINWGEDKSIFTGEIGTIKHILKKYTVDEIHCTPLPIHRGDKCGNCEVLYPHKLILIDKNGNCEECGKNLR